jgi:hypothetical protein
MKRNSVPSATSPTTAYNKFTAQVDMEVSRILGDGLIDKDVIHTLLNGAAAEALKEHVARETRSADGIFFSGKALSHYVASCISKKLKSGFSVADPACGAGDLLLACAAHFETEKCIAASVEDWSRRIIGLDLHGSFASAARSRLKLLAVASSKSNLRAPQQIISDALFENVQQGNYFEHIEKISDVDCVVMNPPFGTVVAPKECSWATGNVQLAGLFLASVVSNGKEGQEIVAVLPDVLRSGTRYARWREFISKQAVIKKVFVYGRFDEKTDVDVFVVHLEKDRNALKKTSVGWSCKQQPENGAVPKMEQRFKVSVGAYVPFRATEETNVVPYLSVNEATPDQKVEVNNECKFDGTLHQAPFVVIRRTSNPSDLRRVIPTLVTGPRRIAVENHLIVLSPLDGTMQSCEKLLKILNHSDVDKWMNEAIRCRHLTTAIVKQLPLTGWK